MGRHSIGMNSPESRRASGRRRRKSLLPSHSHSFVPIAHPVTHPGLESYELEDHLQGEDDGESHVEDV